MNCGLFGVRFSVLWHKKGAIAPVDYLSTFATAPLCISFLSVNARLNLISPLLQTVGLTVEKF